MRFLACQRMSIEQAGDWADDGEPVVPNFPTGQQNTFLSIRSHKPAYYARVVDMARMSLDVELQALAKYYPGLPKEMLSAYLMSTAVAAAELPIGTVVQIHATYDEAKLVLRDGTLAYTMWSEQPISGIPV